MTLNRRSLLALAAGVPAATVALSSCSPGSLGSSDSSQSGGSGSSAVTITLLVDNTESTITTADAVVKAFMEKNPDITIKVESRPGGTDGDNLVKTKLSTGEMADVFAYNSGSLLQALDPAKNLVPFTSEAFMSAVDDTFKPSVTVGSDVFGVPWGQAMGGGILYNRKIYDDLGLAVPETWADFMANNEKIKGAGKDAVIQSYGDTWTSQLFVLADFHNVTAVDADWATKYTENKAKYVDEPAIKGFQRLEEVFKAGYLNKDFASTKFEQALQKLVDGTGAHYPMLTFAGATYVTLADDAAENIGFFAQPGDDAATYGLTTWTPGGTYIPQTTTGDKLEAAKKFLTWFATPEACDVQSKAVSPTGPYMIKGSTLPDGLPTMVGDLQKFITDGNLSPALEFVSPVKGPNLEKITVEVGSGISSAADGAKRYDEDVKKQAQQLGLPGW